MIFRQQVEERKYQSKVVKNVMRTDVFFSKNVLRLMRTDGFANKNLNISEKHKCFSTNIENILEIVMENYTFLKLISTVVVVQN